MRKRIVLLLIIFFVAAFASLALWPQTKGFPESRVSAAMKEQSQSKNPLHDLNEKAKGLRSGDPTAIGDLADGIMTQYGLLESVADVKEAIKQRLVRAEVRFQKDGLGGVSEKNVALMINDLAAELGAPDFMKTDVRQVRYVRVARMIYMPDLINQIGGPGRDVSKKAKRLSVNPNLSPLEATYVVMDLIYQKLNSPDFQVSPGEFRANLNKRRLERWQAHQERKSQTAGLLAGEPASEPVYELKQSAPTPKSDELRAPAARAAAMSRAEFLSLANSCLDKLHIDR